VARHPIPIWSTSRPPGRSRPKLTALAWNRDPREIKTHCRARSAGAQSALGKKPADGRVLRPTLRHLADRVATRLRAKCRPGRTVTVRVRFADLHSVTRSVTLDTPISATAILAEIAEELCIHTNTSAAAGYRGALRGPPNGQNRKPASRSPPTGWPGCWRRSGSCPTRSGWAIEPLTATNAPISMTPSRRYLRPEGI
jgi:impB/mucB/samB family C-terminal domain